MKIHQSAPQAAAPSSSPGSSAIGFEAPFQYPVSAIDPVQMYQFQSSDHPPRTLDTTNPAHVDAITFEISRMDSDQAAAFAAGLASDAKSNLKSIYQMALTQHRDEASDLYEMANAGHRIWTKGRVNYSNGDGAQTQAHTSQEHADDHLEIAKMKKMGAANTSAHKKEQNISHNDSEVATLNELFDLIDQQNPLAGPSSAMALPPPIAQSNYLILTISGNMGPCNGCKDRIEAFYNRVIQLVEQFRLPRDFKVELVVNYTQEDLKAVRGDTKTQYGYDHNTPSFRAIALETVDQGNEVTVQGFQVRRHYVVPRYVAPASSSSSSSALASSGTGASASSSDATMQDSSGKPAS